MCPIKDTEALTGALVTRWSPSHVLISASRLRNQVFQGLYTSREPPPPFDTTAPPDIQSQKKKREAPKPEETHCDSAGPSWPLLRSAPPVWCTLSLALYPVSPRAECRTSGAFLRLASHLLLTVGVVFYNRLWQDVNLAVAIFRAATQGATTGTAFDVSAAQA